MKLDNNHHVYTCKDSVVLRIRLISDTHPPFSVVTQTSTLTISLTLYIDHRQPFQLFHHGATCLATTSHNSLYQHCIGGKMKYFIRSHRGRVGYVTRVADVPSRQRLYGQLNSSNQLAVPPFNRSTVGKRAFSVSGANFWNSFPPHVTSCTIAGNIQIAS